MHIEDINTITHFDRQILMDLKMQSLNSLLLDKIVKGLIMICRNYAIQTVYSPSGFEISRQEHYQQRNLIESLLDLFLSRANYKTYVFPSVFLKCSIQMNADI